MADKVVSTDRGGLWLAEDGKGNVVATVDLTRLDDGRRKARYEQLYPAKVVVDALVDSDDDRSDEDLARDIIFLRGKTTVPLFHRSAK